MSLLGSICKILEIKKMGSEVYIYGGMNAIARGECEEIGECGTTIEVCPKCKVGFLVSFGRMA